MCVRRSVQKHAHEEPVDISSTERHNVVSSQASRQSPISNFSQTSHIATVWSVLLLLIKSESTGSTSGRRRLCVGQRPSVQEHPYEEPVDVSSTECHNVISSQASRKSPGSNFSQTSHIATVCSVRLSLITMERVVHRAHLKCSG